jgi:hypothetical protein
MTVKGVLLGGLPVQLLLFASLHAQVVPLPADNEVAIGALNLQTAVAPAAVQVESMAYTNFTNLVTNSDGFLLFNHRDEMDPLTAEHCCPAIGFEMTDN